MRLDRPTRLVVTLSRAMVLTTALAAGLAVAVPPASAASTGPGVRPADPVSGRSVLAERALDAAQDALDTAPAERRGGRPTRDVTLVLRDLALRLGDLPAARRSTARELLARPTESNDPYTRYGQRARVTNDCVKHPTSGSHVCVHWARRTSDAPRLADRDGNGLPDQVDLTRNTMNKVWDRIITEGGFRRPPKDTKGPNKKFDVYLADIGGQGLYGYCVPERRVSGRAYSGYCVLDNNYSRREFPTNGPRGNLRVTAAHEFFHAVQFAYDAGEDSWFMESTATWMEDELYTKVNDNLNYLPFSALATPTRPLDYSGGLFVYGNWLWWRYVSERVGAEAGTGLPVVMRRIWEQADNSSKAAPGMYSMEAADSVLSTEGGLATLFGGFSAANLHPALSYTEGSLYPAAPVAHTDSVGAATAISASRTLNHLSSTTVAFTPAEALKNHDLRVQVDGPGRAQSPVVTVTTVRADDTVASQTVPLSATGVGQVTVPRFDVSAVQRVEVTFANGGHAYDCGKGTAWSCSGIPVNNNQRFSYTVDAVRP